MKKYVLSLLLAFAAMLVAFAQPQSIPYQAVARNASGNLLVNQLVALRLTVRDLTSGGTVLYQERDTATTNSLGLFTVNVGQGSGLSGSFGGITWGSGDKYLQVELDPSGGAGYSSMGTSRMASVPYALYAANAGSVPSGNLTDAGTDGISVTSGSGAVIGGGTSIAQAKASGSQNGYLSSTDWTTFNGKQNALTIGNLTDAGTDGIAVTSGAGAIIGSGTSIAQAKASASQNGYLASTDWSTFNNKAGGSGTSNYLARWTSTGAPGTLSTGEIQDNGTTVGVNASPSGSIMLSVAGGGSLNGLNATTTNSAAGSYALLANGASSLNAYLGYVGTLTNVFGGTVTNPAAYISDAAGGATNGVYVSSTGTNSALLVSASGGVAANFMTTAAGTFGVYSQVSDPGSIGFQGVNAAASGTGTGDGTHGVTAQSSGYGILGANLNSGGTAIAGYGANSTYVNVGPYGVVGGVTATALGYGAVVGTYWTTAASVHSQGVLGYYTGGLYYGLAVTGGSKSAIVETGPHEHRAVFCLESAENYFEDMGEAKIVNGKGTVNIDPTFLRTITVDETHPMMVYITLEGETPNTVYVKKGTTSFEVAESNGGQSNVSFMYRIAGHRKGYENNRLNVFDEHDWEQLQKPQKRPSSVDALQNGNSTVGLK